MAKTMLNYNAIDPGMISFPRNQQVRVLSKEAGSNPEVWGIEVQGRRGYAPKQHLQEYQVIVKKDKLIEVPTESFMPKPDQTQPQADAQSKIDESTVKVESAPSENNDINGTVSVEKLERPQATDDNQIISESANEINGKMVSVEVEQQQKHDAYSQKVVLETVNEKIETIEPLEAQKEIREHDDEDDEGFSEEEMEEEGEGNVDDEEMKEYAGREPVKEPPFIEKHAYKTGEKDVENLEDADVKLEIIGSDAKRPEENNLFENNTFSTVENETEKIDELSNDVQEKNVPAAVESDVATSNEATSEVQNEQMPEATTELLQANSETDAAPSEIRKEEIETNAATNDTIEAKNETNEPRKLDANAEVEQNIENLISGGNETVPVEASKESALPPPVEDKQGATEVTEEIEEPTKIAGHDSAGTTADDMYRHIKNALKSAQENIVPSPEVPSHLNPSVLANQLQGVNAEHVLHDYHAEEPVNPDSHQVNVEDVNKVDLEIPSNDSVDPVKIVETTEIPNAVEETQDPPTPIVDLPEIEEELPPTLNQINEEVLPTTPLPILDHETSEDIFTSRPIPLEADRENVETVETGNWYDGVVEIAFDACSSVLRLFDSGAAEKNEGVASHLEKTQAVIDTLEDGYCEKLDDGSCPKHPPKSVHTHDQVIGAAIHHMKNVKYDEFAQEFLTKVVAMADLVILLALTATAVLIFILGHYCLANNHKESALISKLNIIEKKLLVSEKECSIVKADLIQTRKQLVSIEDSSFGSNDMVIALKQQLAESESEKLELQQQIVGLEKVSHTIAHRICIVFSENSFF